MIFHVIALNKLAILHYITIVYNMNDLLGFILEVKLKEKFSNPILLLKIFSAFCKP
jgi:hypothetical protein